MTIFGWDMSHYDAPGIGDALEEGISFITHKAGGDANDAEVGQWWSGVRSRRANVLLGAYWVQYPGNPTGRADAFLARLDATCPGWRDGPFILQVDAEEWNGNSATAPSVSEVNAFCDRLVSKTNGKYRPIGYLPGWVYGDGSHGSMSAFKYPIWQSSYVAGSGGWKALYPGDSSSRWNAYGAGAKAPTILQYSSKATIGNQTTSDANAYRGTLAQLTTLVTPNGSAPKPPAPKPPASGIPHFANGSRENSTAKNNFGSDVYELQKFIGPAKCGKADGHYGPNTKSGVKWYQDMRGLLVDGIAGKNTWAPIVKVIGR